MTIEENSECYDCGLITTLVYQGRCSDCDEERHKEE